MVHTAKYESWVGSGICRKITSSMLDPWNFGYPWFIHVEMMNISENARWDPRREAWAGNIHLWVSSVWSLTLGGESDHLQRKYYVWMEKSVTKCRWSDQISRSVVSDSLQPHESQHARPPCLSPTPGVPWDSRPSSQWCHPAISSSVIPFSSCPQSLPASESFPMSQLLAWGGQSIGVSALASFLPKKSQGWSPSEWTGWISLQSKWLSRGFSNTTVQKVQVDAMVKIKRRKSLQRSTGSGL